MRSSGFLLLLACAAIAAPPGLELPKEATGDVAAFIRVEARTSGRNVRWVALDSGLNLFPIDLLRDSKTAVVTSSRPGRYRLLAVTAAGDEISEPAVCTVVIGEAPTPPTPPGPGPGPQPEDPLAKAIRAAFATEKDPQRAIQADALRALYKQAATAAFLDSCTTWGALFDAMRQAAGSLGVSGKLPAVQKVISVGPLSELPTERQRPLDATGRKQAAAAFLTVAAVLEGLR